MLEFIYTPRTTAKAAPVIGAGDYLPNNVLERSKVSPMGAVASIAQWLENRGFEVVETRALFVAGQLELITACGLAVSTSGFVTTARKN